MSSKENRIVIKVRRVENVHEVKKIIIGFSRETGQLLSLIVCCVRLIWLGIATLTLSSEKKTGWGIKTLWPAYHWQCNQPVATQLRTCMLSTSRVLIQGLGSGSGIANTIHEDWKHFEHQIWTFYLIRQVQSMLYSRTFRCSHFVFDFCTILCFYDTSHDRLKHMWLHL